MAKLQTQNTKAKKPYIDPCGGMGRGGNIRIVTPTGDVVPHDPSAYRGLKGHERGAVTKAVCAAIGVAA